MRGSPITAVASTGGRRQRIHLTHDAMELPVRNVRRVNQVVLGEFVVAGRIRGRYAALVHPEQMDAVPMQVGDRQLLEKQLGSDATRDGEGSEFLGGERGLQQADDVMRAGFGGCRRIRLGKPADAHLSVGYARRTAEASVRWNTGSFRTMRSSSRMRK